MRIEALTYWVMTRDRSDLQSAARRTQASATTMQSFTTATRATSAIMSSASWDGFTSASSAMAAAAFPSVLFSVIALCRSGSTVFTHSIRSALMAPGFLSSLTVSLSTISCSSVGTLRWALPLPSPLSLSPPPLFLPAWICIWKARAASRGCSACIASAAALAPALFASASLSASS